MKPSPVPDCARAQYPTARVAEIGKPPGYSDDEIGSLPALIDRSDPRWPAIRSYWRPSSEEIALLLDGGYIELEVIAHQMIPVGLNILAEGLSA